MAKANNNANSLLVVDLKMLPFGLLMTKFLMTLHGKAGLVDRQTLEGSSVGPCDHRHILSYGPHRHKDGA